MSAECRRDARVAHARAARPESRARLPELRRGHLADFGVSLSDVRFGRSFACFDALAGPVRNCGSGAVRFGERPRRLTRGPVSHVLARRRDYYGSPEDCWCNLLKRGGLRAAADQINSFN